VRGVSGGALLLCAAGACAHPPPPIEGPLVEVWHYEGRPNEKPAIPGIQLETLVRFEPKLPAYRLRRLRFLLGQPGRIVFTFYGEDPRGGPGPMLAQIDRRYGPELISSNEPGDLRWVVEELAALPLRRGAFYLGISAPERGADPRLWGTNTDAGMVFERELDGSIGRFRHTPVVRVEIAPGEPELPARHPRSSR
jgi:hypothetical protein